MPHAKRVRATPRAKTKPPRAKTKSPRAKPGSPRRKTKAAPHAAAVPRIKATPPPRESDPFAKKTGARRSYYTGEFLAEAKRRVERTAQSMTAIAGNFGMHHSTLSRLIAREGWIRPESSGRRRGLSPVMRLAAAADALVQGAGAHPAPHPDPLPDIRAFTPVFDGLCGEREQTALTGPSSPDNSAVDRLEQAVLKELATVETMRASLGAEPLRPTDAERTARTLATLTETLAKLRRLRLGAQPQSDLTDHDILDIDAFRLDLARRIDLFVASQTDREDADGDSGAAALGEAG
jgi:hypothetical protein